MRGLFASSERAEELDLPAVVDWMLATGCRIEEALVLRYGPNGDGKPLPDLDAGTWEVNGTVVRVPVQGLIVQPRTKTTAGWRVIAVPGFAIEMLRARSTPNATKGVDRIVFATPFAAGLRDPNNVSGDLWQLLDSFGEVCDGNWLPTGARRQVPYWPPWTAPAVRRRVVVVGHVAHVPQDGWRPDSRSCVRQRPTV